MLHYTSCAEQDLRNIMAQALYVQTAAVPRPCAARHTRAQEANVQHTVQEHSSQTSAKSCGSHGRSRAAHCCLVHSLRLCMEHCRPIRCRPHSPLQGQVHWGVSCLGCCAAAACYVVHTSAISDWPAQHSCPTTGTESKAASLHGRHCQAQLRDPHNRLAF